MAELSSQSSRADPLPSAGQSGARGPVHKRTYKACEACRQHKAKCEASTSSSACMKCLREKRQCVFPLQRSTKRARTASAAIDDRPRGNGHAATAAQQQPWQHQAPAPAQEGQLEQGRTPDVADGTSQLDSDVMRAVVTSSRDAIGLLFSAADHEEDDAATDGSEPGVDADDASMGLSPGLPLPSWLSPSTLGLWQKHRFVMQGWFTAHQAVMYMEFFFQHLAPLSPVVDSLYADHRSHDRLILDEPLLCCTILLISSRHHALPGLGGATRSSFIHARLWKHIEHLVQRITFGSEKYSSAKSRTLGSIQALLLLVDWNPRALHFPPENDGWDTSLVLVLDAPDQPARSRASDATQRWREDIFEPSKRSDRLSWMLAGLATTLAHELGIFDDSSTASSYRDLASHVHRLHIRRLLYLYTSQLSLRLGCTNIFPESSRQGITSPPPGGDVPETQEKFMREMLLTQWVEITKLLTAATHMFFANTHTTKQLLASFRYVSLLEHYSMLLDKWHRDFTSVVKEDGMEPAHQLLKVEYYYVRMYINSIAIQAVVDRTSQTNAEYLLLDQELMRTEYAHDFRSVDEVRETSGHILAIATCLGELGILQYCPVRFFLRVVSASIFMLKALSLGVRETDAAAAFTQLEQCIAALKKSAADDVHLSARYADLMARHVRRFKRSLRSKRKERGTATMDIPNHVSSIRDRDLSRHITTLGAGRNEILDTNQFHANFNDDPNGAVRFADVLGGEDDQFTDYWLGQPFDPRLLAPGPESMQFGAGLAMDSLDFLWNLPA